MTSAAVVLVNYRSSDLVLRCVASLDLPDAEVIVVDNASADGSVEQLRAAGLRVHERDGNDGFAAGVNAGIAATEAEVVCVLNPDCEARPGALRALVAHLDCHQRAAIAAPRLLHPDGSVQPSAYRKLPGLGLIALELSIPAGYLIQALPAIDRHRIPAESWVNGMAVAHVYGAAFAIRREAWRQTGGLDEGFFLYLEETEWQGRLTAAGWSIELVPEAEVIHLVRGGGAAALAPSVHFLRSAERYLGLRGVPRLLSRTAIAAAVTSSRIGLRALGLLGRRGEQSRRAAVEWDALWHRWRVGG